MRGSMASKKDAFKRAMVRYLGECGRRGLSPKSVETYDWALGTVQRALAEKDRVKGPTTFGVEQAEIAYEALNRSPGGMWYLNAFLRRHGNDVLRDAGLLRPRPPSTRIRWLDIERGEDLVVTDTAMQMGPPFSTLVHLELRLLFRRISCLRARLVHFGPQQVLVHGKGRHGGTVYAISPHPETDRVLRDHEAWRRAKVDAARHEGFFGTPPDWVFLAHRHGELGAYRSASRLNEWLRDVGRESGVRIGGHHTLRRTGGRKLWIAGVPVETVSEILGHASVDMTIRYLGINISDMAKAQRRLADYEASHRLVQVRDADLRPSGTSQ